MWTPPSPASEEIQDVFFPLPSLPPKGKTIPLFLHLWRKVLYVCVCVCVGGWEEEEERAESSFSISCFTFFCAAAAVASKETSLSMHRERRSGGDV